MSRKKLKNCLLLPDVQGFVLFQEQSNVACEPESSSALCNRSPQLFKHSDTLLIVPGKSQPPPPSARKAILTVLPTTNCNLRCSYCYASSGNLKKELSFQQYQVILHDVVDLSRFGQLQLHLHGGGEPTLNPQLFRDIVQECATRCKAMFVVPSFTLTTNGTFGAQVRQTIEEYRIRCSISWDGPDDIQHRQRPFSSGENSHQVVLRNMRDLVSLRLMERVRVTVTPHNIDRLPEIIRFLHQEGVPSVHIEPVSILGRQEEKTEEGITVARYALHFQQAYILCCQLGLEMKGLGMMIFKPPSGRYCGAFGWNFVVTPWGEISACTRVQQQSDKHAESFLLGPWIPGADPMTFASSQRKTLQRRRAEKLTACADCFLRHHCAGGCPMSIPDSYDTNLERTDDLPCDLTRECCSLVLAAVRQGHLPPGWISLHRNF
jgi:uncharacterized protein